MHPLEGSVPEVPSYRDRKSWLVVFGLATIAAGLVCLLLLPLIFFGQSHAIKQGNAEAVKGSLSMIAGLYGSLAIFLVWLGVGSILTRRWARALLVVWSWIWLVFGVVMTVVMAFFLRHLPALAARPPTAGPMPPTGLIYAVSLGSFAFFGILLPLIWVLFYGSRNVRLTCEVRDPVPRWTDRCPLPVLALSLWLLFSGISCLWIIFTPFHLMPFFGLFVMGVPAICLLVVLGLVWLFVARSVFRLEGTGWWLTLILVLLYALSSAITYSRHDLIEVYTALHYSPATIAQVTRISGTGRSWLIWGPFLFTIPLVGYLLFVRRYFRRVA